jgi:hypothetical protein
MNSNFFTPVGNTKPYFKVAFEGFAGSGKTYTAALVAIGLHRRIGSKKPIVIFDTEKASKFLRKLFNEAGIQLMVRESRTLADLKETMKLLRDGYSDILIIDSISHVWEDTVEAYKRKPLKLGRAAKTRLEFQDWGILKPTWRTEFSDPLVNDPYHVIMCGRAGFEYENEINKETGKREIYKSGIKMKVEGDTAYEPDMLVLMERFEEILTDKKKVYRQATIVKDRGVLDGKTFINPSYENFVPSVEDLLENPTVNEQSAVKDSADLFRTEEDKQQYIRQKEIVLEEIGGWLLKAWPSMGAAEKLAKQNVIEQVFDTTSWTAVTQKGLESLRYGLESVKAIVDAEMKKRFPDVAEAQEKESKPKVMAAKQKRIIKGWARKAPRKVEVSREPEFVSG